MADLANLKSGDLVLWVLKNEIVQARVVAKTDSMVQIRVQRESGDILRWVTPNVLRLIRVRSLADREARKKEAADELAMAYMVGPGRVKEVFEKWPSELKGKTL